jgi:hypothetical protein
VLLSEPLLVSHPPAVTEHVAELVVLWVIVRVAGFTAVAAVALAGFAAAACSVVEVVVVAPVVLDAVPEHPVAPRSHCASASARGRPAE